uniref:Tubulin/FtsZ 2-layer sandwich domain-containing protein n=1 Tax=Nymphaea colorata TaxID=210225 RepID=A0A5K1HGA7_9MAGN|nr:unnamed protein product [Nymphaea colorata]
MASCDPKKGQYLACSLYFRGDHSPKDINKLTAELKAKKTLKFADWCPSGFKVCLNYQAPRVLPGGDLCKEMRTLGTLSNTTAISSFLERFNKDFDKMYAKKAFLHWYAKEGMEEGFFG